MKPLTREWVKKAEGDFVTASREFRSRSSPNFDAVCFHAQQCAEKYMKVQLIGSSSENSRSIAAQIRAKARLDLGLQ